MKLEMFDTIVLHPPEDFAKDSHIGRLRDALAIAQARREAIDADRDEPPDDLPNLAGLQPSQRRDLLANAARDRAQQRATMQALAAAEANRAHGMFRDAYGSYESKVQEYHRLLDVHDPATQHERLGRILERLQHLKLDIDQYHAQLT